MSEQWIECHAGVTTPTGDVICEAPIHYLKSRDAWPANSKKIAAVPDMIDQLKNLCNVFGQGLDPVKNECAYRAIAKARAVIAKVEGGAV